MLHLYFKKQVFSELLHRLYIGRCRIHVFQGLMSERAKTTGVYKMSFLTSVEIDIFEAISLKASDGYKRAYIHDVAFTPGLSEQKDQHVQGDIYYLFCLDLLRICQDHW